MRLDLSLDPQAHLGRQPVLTRDIVAECRARYHAKTATVIEMAIEYGVHPTTMRLACRGETWSDRNPNEMPPPDGMQRIPGYSSYFIDTTGIIWSARQRDELHSLTYGTSGSGYKVFLIADGRTRGHTVQVHDLACLTWHGERPTSSHRVMHADGNRRNNASTNISWQEPTRIPRTGGSAVGEAHGRAKMTTASILLILAYHANGERQSDIARHLNVHPTTVAGVVSRRLWKHVHIPVEGLPVVNPLPRLVYVRSSDRTRGRSKLSEEAVNRIANALPATTNAELARTYHVHPTTIARLRQG